MLWDGLIDGLVCCRATERMRIPMILQNSDFAKNPFQTIRTHAQNTLVRHEIPK